MGCAREPRMLPACAWDCCLSLRVGRAQSNCRVAAAHRQMCRCTSSPAIPTHRAPNQTAALRLRSGRCVDAQAALPCPHTARTTCIFPLFLHPFIRVIGSWAARWAPLCCGACRRCSRATCPPSAPSSSSASPHPCRQVQQQQQQQQLGALHLAQPQQLLSTFNPIAPPPTHPHPIPPPFLCTGGSVQAGPESGGPHLQLIRRRGLWGR